MAEKNIDPDILQKFGDRLRLIRKERNISQEELGNLSQLDRTYIGSVERGERNVSLINIKKISLSLNISLKELFDFE